MLVKHPNFLGPRIWAQSSKQALNLSSLACKSKRGVAVGGSIASCWTLQTKTATKSSVHPGTSIMHKLYENFTALSNQFAKLFTKKGWKAFILL